MALAQVVTHLAVLTPFLLLPSCRSLHVKEDGRAPEETLIFGTHHKTGTELVKAASKCFNESFNVTLDNHWKGDQLLPYERACHFTRNPITLALSAYIYHTETGEEWTWRAGGEMEHVAKDSYLQTFLNNSNESYTEFLRRVDARIGIQAEMNRLSRGTGVLDEMETAEKFCESRSRCMHICLEDFTASSSSYDASWSKVFNFMGKNVTPEIHDCLSKEDLNRNPVSSVHVTSNALPKWRYNELRNIVVDVDATVFNGRLKKMGVGKLYCGGYFSDFLDFVHGSNATTDGGGYAEWLTEGGDTGDT